MAILAVTMINESSLVGQCDDSLLFNGCEKSYQQLYSKPEEHQRRSIVTIHGKFFHVFLFVILFCILLYIPIYNKANDFSSKDNSKIPKDKPEGSIAGWSITTNRDTRIYVQPNNNTIIHEPKNLCTNTTRDKKNKLFLLIIVCSATTNFEQRKAIRETWGHRVEYYKISKIFNAINDKSNLNFEERLAKALEANKIMNDEVPEKTLVNDDILPEFYMNKELSEYSELHYNYEEILNMRNNFPEIDETAKIMPDFKVVFMLGLPAHDNDTSIKGKIEEEVKEYGDIIQEGFVDFYNNLTMKSIMMLKWISNKCNESVRYILKTDDDTYINLPSLLANLQECAKEHDKIAKNSKQDEYLLMGYLFAGEKPVRNFSNKWHSPQYMYDGSQYPCFLSGTGYVLSTPTARALYKSALTTPYFHLEDVYITGICALRAKPRIVPRFGFTYVILSEDDPCCVHNHVTTHRVDPSQMRILHQRLLTEYFGKKCERFRISQGAYSQRFKNWMVSSFAC